MDMKELLNAFSENFSDPFSNLEIRDATTRLVCSTVRKYNQLYDEHERLKDFVGFNKAFPIMRLPRELRDEIYTHALRATGSAVDAKLQIYSIHFADNHRKPPTPSLLRVSRQVNSEAIEKLYTDNILKFHNPGELFDFERHIGAQNTPRVKNICIWVRFPAERETIADPKDLPQPEYDSVPSHWIAALRASGLTQVVHLGIEGEFIGGHPLSTLLMPKDLEGSVKEFLGRAEGDSSPRLSLTGFREEGREKFPASWDVVMASGHATRKNWQDFKRNGTRSTQILKRHGCLRTKRTCNIISDYRDIAN